MKIHRLSPILWTKNLEATTRFYTEILGFSGNSNFPNFVTLTYDNAEIMFIVPNEEPEACDDPENNEPFFPKAHLTGSIFIYMQGVDEYWKKLKDKTIIKLQLQTGRI